MALNNSQKLLAGTLALVLVVGMTSTAYASLIGDTIHFKLGGVITLCEGDVVVVDPGVEIICFLSSVDIDGDSIWFETVSSFPNGTPIAGVTYEFTDLDWVDNSDAIIIGVEIVSPTNIPVGTPVFDDHSISITNLSFPLDCGVESSCIAEWHLDIQTNHGQAIGGTYIPIDQSALLLAGVQSVSMWMIPVVIAGIGIGVFVIKRRN